MRPGDIILAINGRAVNSHEDCVERLGPKAGQCTLEYARPEAERIAQDICGLIIPQCTEQHSD
eukprot:6475864-Prymnesium_polylepis.2